MVSGIAVPVRINEIEIAVHYQVLVVDPSDSKSGMRALKPGEKIPRECVIALYGYAAYMRKNTDLSRLHTALLNGTLPPSSITVLYA